MACERHLDLAGISHNSLPLSLSLSSDLIAYLHRLSLLSSLWHQHQSSLPLTQQVLRQATLASQEKEKRSGSPPPPPLANLALRDDLTRPFLSVRHSSKRSRLLWLWRSAKGGQQGC